MVTNVQAKLISRRLRHVAETFRLEKRKSVSVGTLSGYRSDIKDMYRLKAPLPFLTYHKLCRATLKRHDDGLAHRFLTTVELDVSVIIRADILFQTSDKS
ncbi:hypothetical protein PHMEG_00015318 [Phytophthora megakarya]|uniref:Uncharacterized protein n=1 Tax=Phytophthora megakarya TaxID=4795 RepID=A0A225W251_9STRA|nr:hypothetical protein PHMEG_00015318 [Phytophthora megakarya]